MALLHLLLEWALDKKNALEMPSSDIQIKPESSVGENNNNFMASSNLQIATPNHSHPIIDYGQGGVAIIMALAINSIRKMLFKNSKPKGKQHISDKLAPETINKLNPLESELER